MPQDSEKTEPGTITVYPVHLPTAADTIDLVSIWTVLRRHRKPFLLILILTVLAGLAVSLLTPKEYTLSTTLEIGSYYNDGSITHIENISSVRSRILNSYLPRHQTAASDPSDSQRPPNVRVKGDKSQNIIVITSTVYKSDLDRYARLHKLIVEDLVSDHQKLSIKLSDIMNREREMMSSILSSGNAASKATSLSGSMQTRYMLDDTSLLDEPTLSIKPVSMSRSIMMALFTLLALVVSVTAVIVLEISRRARARGDY